MIDLMVVSQFMYENFERVSVTKGGTHFLCRCPLCGDSKISIFKRRFNLNWNNGEPIFHCFNCDESGSFTNLYARIKGIDTKEAWMEINKYNKDNTIKKIKKDKHKKKKKEIKIEEKFNWILKDCIGLNYKTDSISGKKYIKILNDFYEERKISKKYKLFIAKDGRYKNRIIIPIFDKNNNIVYFQARRIPRTKRDPKYLNPESPKELIVLHEHLFTPNLPIVITEGIIDAYTLGYQATTCIGKYITDNFIERLLKYSKDLIVCLDNDIEAYKSLKKFMKENSYARYVKYFLYPSNFEHYKDINNIRQDGVNNIFDIIIKNTVDYSAAVTNLFYVKNVLEGKNENNKNKFRCSLSR